MGNRILITGCRLVADPTTTTLPSGTSVTKARIASNNVHRQDDGTYGTNWYNVSFFGARGDMFAKHFTKGNVVNVFGDLVIRDYVDKNGQTRQSIDIEHADWEFCPKNVAGDAVTSEQSRPAAPAATKPTFAAASDDELPGVPASDDELPF